MLHDSLPIRSIIATCALTAATATIAEMVFDLDAFEVRGYGLPGAALDYAQPIKELNGQDLRPQLTVSLGDSLDGQLGISSTSYFPGASRPILRGFTNDRIRVLSNGLDTLDASIGSHDHPIGLDPNMMDSVEIIRGPATLLYGSNAVGGVVNVIDSRVPITGPAHGTKGHLRGQYASVSDGWTGSGKVIHTENRFLFSGSFLWRDHGDVRIPGYAATDPELQAQQESGRSDNSFVKTREAVFGSTARFERGFIGLSFSRFETEYGLGRETEQEFVSRDTAGNAIIERELDDYVTIDGWQNRFDLQAGLKQPLPGFESLRLRVGAANYRHGEFEDGILGTTFQNRGWEARLELAQEVRDWIEGAVGLQASRSKFSATGDEAFLRPTTSLKLAAFVFEELPFEHFKLQLGARIEHISMSPELYERDAITGVTTPPDRYRKWGGNGSIGAVIPVLENAAIRSTFAYTERLLSAQELYADGPHIGTFSYEVSDHALGGNFDRERSYNWDIGLRWDNDRMRGEISFFANRFSDYVALRVTDELAFENADETFTIVPESQVDNAFLQNREAAGEDNEFIGVTRYIQSNALYYGAEAELMLRIWDEGLNHFDFGGMVDFVRARDRDASINIPRIPPMRVGLKGELRLANTAVESRLMRVFSQTHTAPFETETRAYTMLSIALTHRFTWNQHNGSIFLRGENLLNSEARPHTSFMTDLQPLPGRGVSVGLQWDF